MQNRVSALDEDRLLKGTTTIGLVCKDGVVLATERRATAGNLIANKQTQKLFKIDQNIGITIAGLVGDAQTLTRYLKAEVFALPPSAQRPAQCGRRRDAPSEYPVGKPDVPVLRVADPRRHRCEGWPRLLRRPRRRLHRGPVRLGRQRLDIRLRRAGGGGTHAS